MSRIEITSGPPPDVIRDALTGNRRAKIPSVTERTSKVASRVAPAKIEVPQVDVAETSAVRSALPWILGLVAGLTMAVGASLMAPTATHPPIHRKQPTSAGNRDVDPPATPSTEIAVDQHGAVTRIDGKNPREVLEAFVAKTEGGWEAVELRPTVPHQPNARVGVLRPIGGAAEQAIWIRFEKASKRWFVGNGQEPVEPAPLPVPEQP